MGATQFLHLETREHSGVGVHWMTLANKAQPPTTQAQKKLSK